MNKTALYIVNIIMRLGFVAGAIIMALNDIKGYGWLIFGAIITGMNFTTTTKSD